MILKKKKQKHIFFDEGKGASSALWRLMLDGWWWASYKSNFCPRMTVSSPTALDNAFRRSSVVVDARPMDGQLDPAVPDFIRIFSFHLFAITLLRHRVQLVAELPIIDAKRENYDHGTEKGAEGWHWSTLLNQFINKTMTASDLLHGLKGEDCRDSESAIRTPPIGACSKTLRKKASGTFSKLSQ